MKIIKGPDNKKFGLVVSRDELLSITAALAKTGRNVRTEYLTRHGFFLDKEEGYEMYEQLAELTEKELRK